MTVLGAALVAAGAACIALGAIWYFVNRHRSHHLDSPAWAHAFADTEGAAPLPKRRASSRGIEIYDPTDRSSADNEALAIIARRSEAPVLVTGTSTPSGVAVVRALVAAGYEVVALDHDEFAPGLRLAQLGAVIPTADAPDFGVTLAKIAERTGARSLVPGDGTELEALSAAASLLGEAGVATWLPSHELIAACADRTALSAKLMSFAPRRSTESHVAEEHSCRSFEADLLAVASGSLVAAVPRWRLATWGGQTMATETFESDDMSSLLDEICRYLQLEGPATVAGVLAKDRDAVITDVSLGFSPCVALNAAAGADMVIAYTKKLRGEGLPRSLMPYRSGVRMVRHLDEVFES
jgi:carbamoyl-phosphate synthase large subunit